MIKVYLRDKTGEHSQLLGEFFPDAIRELPDLFKTSGQVGDNGCHTVGAGIDQETANILRASTTLSTGG